MKAVHEPQVEEEDKDAHPLDADSNEDEEQ